MVSYKELAHFVWRFLRQQKRAFFCIFLLDAFTWPLDMLLWPYILYLVVDIFTRFDHNRLAAWSALQGPIIGGLCLVFCVEIASRTMGFLMDKAIPRLQASMRIEMFNHIQHHSPRYFNERFAGSLANKITDMTTHVESILQQLFFPLIPASVASILSAVFLWFVNPLFAWILLGWICVHLGICLYFARKCDHYEHAHGEARSTLLGKIVDSLTNNFAVNLFYRFQYEKKSLKPFQEEEMRTNIRSKLYSEAMRCVTSFFFIIGVIVGILGLIVYLWLHNYISTGQAVQVFSTSWRIGAIMWMVGSSLPILFQSVGTAKQAYSVMRDSPDLGDPEKAQPLTISSGAIRFENVSFHYGEKSLFTNKRAYIRGGERVGLVGYTGAGKSTFINLILRFFPLKGGTILIDGQDIAQVSLESLRRRIALIPQDPILFHRTLQENIGYGNPQASEAEIYRAARYAHCDEFIRRLPQGYASKVGERGTKLSGGEKQRIAIARALLADAPILILDEATSALDSVTETYIQESLEKLMHNRTTLVIAHRLSTLAHMDRLLVFDQGKIVEDGTHTSLIEKGGHYAQMWKMQAGGFLPEKP